MDRKSHIVSGTVLDEVDVQFTHLYPRHGFLPDLLLFVGSHKDIRLPTWSVSDVIYRRIIVHTYIR
jgi:hypothetical protein